MHPFLNGRQPERPPPSSGLKPAFEDVRRTRVTNGKQILPGIDGRTYWVKRVRDILDRHIDDLGGLDACSEAEKSVVRRCAVLVVELERLERRFALIDVDANVPLSELQTYCTLANTLRRLLDMAGLERRSKDITPSIDQYVAQHASDTDGTDVVDADYVDVVRLPNRHDYKKAARVTADLRAAYLAGRADAEKEAAE